MKNRWRQKEQEQLLTAERETPERHKAQVLALEAEARLTELVLKLKLRSAGWGSTNSTERGEDLLECCGQRPYLDTQDPPSQHAAWHLFITRILQALVH